MAKTLIDFRAEKGLYLKDVAETIGVTEEELSKAEASDNAPDYITQKLIVAYNLPEDYFAEKTEVKPVVPIKNLKAYFFKASLGAVFLLSIVSAVPMWIDGIITTIIHMNANTTGALNIYKEIYGIISDIFTVVAIFVYCHLFAKHIMKKTGLSGDIYKYRYLYEVIPSGVVASISIISSLITTLALKETLADESKVYLMPIGYGITFIVSLISMVIVALVMASLLNTAIMDDEILKAKRHKTMAIIVTVSSVLAYVLTIYANTLEPYPTYNAIIRRIFVYGVYIAVAWLVYFAKDNNKTKTSFAFEILPIISIVDTLLFGLIRL